VQGQWEFSAVLVSANIELSYSLTL